MIHHTAFVLVYCLFALFSHLGMYCTVLYHRLYCYKCIGVWGRVDRALDSRSKELGFDSHWWYCVKESGKLFISCCLCLHSNDWYLVEERLCLSGSSCLFVWGVLCSPKGDNIVQVCVLYQGRTWYGQMNIDNRYQTLNYIPYCRTFWCMCL